MKGKLKFDGTKGFIIAIILVFTMAINMFGWSTIETPFCTMQYFPDSIRSNDILLLNFSWEQLWKNAQSLVKQVFLQNIRICAENIPESASSVREPAGIQRSGWVRS